VTIEPNDVTIEPRDLVGESRQRLVDSSDVTSRDLEVGADAIDILVDAAHMTVEVPAEQASCTVARRNRVQDGWHVTIESHAALGELAAHCLELRVQPRGAESAGCTPNPADA